VFSVVEIWRLVAGSWMMELVRLRFSKPDDTALCSELEGCWKIEDRCTINLHVNLNPQFSNLKSQFSNQTQIRQK
jgi:hypothetical protein